MNQVRSIIREAFAAILCIFVVPLLIFLGIVSWLSESDEEAAEESYQ